MLSLLGILKEWIRRIKSPLCWTCEDDVCELCEVYK